MKQESLVSFETSRKLKELGYNLVTEHAYDSNYKEQPVWTRILSFFWPDRDNYSPAPTPYQVSEWLREEKKILISIRPNNHINDSGNQEIHYAADIFSIENNHLRLLNSEAGYENYEFALEDSVNEALDLLKKKENGE